MNSWEKYIKYKNKYINLKKQQKGGEWNDAVEFGKTCGELNLSGWTKEDITIDSVLTFKNNDTIEPKLTFNVIRKSFENSKDKPVLVAMAGLSLKSFCNSSQIIVSNVEKLREKFGAVYIISLDPFKQYQVDACVNYRDKVKETLNKESILRTDLSESEFNLIYESEIRLNIEMSKMINEIISTKLGLTNVHLLGKCAGGGISIELVSQSDIYKSLYLAVPGSPIHIKPLTKLSTERLTSMNFIFGWNENDIYPFNFVKESRMEKATYDEEISKMEKSMNIKIYYESHMFTPGNGHEINEKLIDKISRL